MQLKTIKSIAAAALCAVGLTAFAAEQLTVDKVESESPWDSKTGKITVNYKLGGVDAKTDYKVAFDITAGDETASFTNAAGKVTNGSTNTVINTVGIFGQEVVDPQAKVKVSLIAVKPKKEIPAGQLWKDGPIWAECNVGAATPEGYGDLYKFGDAEQAVKTLAGGWRLPTQEEFAKLTNATYCTSTWDTNKKGRTFTGVGDYSTKSIFLPAAGFDFDQDRQYDGSYGYYRSSSVKDENFAYYFHLEAGCAKVGFGDRGYGMSVRAVRDAK